MSTAALPNTAGSLAGSPAHAAGSTTAAQSATGTIAARAGAFVVLLGTMVTLVAISWDVQWHVEVGPDTFFTLSHLFLYAGTALAGLASLVMVLLATSAQRAGRPWPRTVGGTPVRVFGGAFTAPLGYLVSGIGSAAFLLYGLLDLWWHGVYGFDAVLNTPSHVALFLSISITMVGSVIVFASAREQLWGRLGVLFSIPILITFAPISANGLSSLPLPVDPVIIGIILFSPMLLIIGAAILRRPGAAIAIAAVLGAMQAFLWAFSPWAAHAYAAASGLPLRDGLTPQPPTLPGSVPMFLGLAAVVVEIAFWMIRSRNVNGGKVMLATGAVTGLIVAVTLPLQQVLTDPSASFGFATIALIGVIGIVFGTLAGYLGGRFTTMMNALAPALKGA
jgi:hypothetical protein